MHLLVKIRAIQNIKISEGGLCVLGNYRESNFTTSVYLLPRLFHFVYIVVQNIFDSCNAFELYLREGMM